MKAPPVRQVSGAVKHFVAIARAALALILVTAPAARAQLLIVADGGYLAFLDVARLESGKGEPVLGYMGSGAPVGFIYVNVTADDKYLFASAERAASVIVIDLEQARAGGFKERGAVAKLDVGNAPISVALSPDGRFLYTTSEAALPEWGWPQTCRPENPNARDAAPKHSQGAIIVFDACSTVVNALSSPTRTASVGTRWTDSH